MKTIPLPADSMTEFLSPSVSRRWHMDFLLKKTPPILLTPLIAESKRTPLQVFAQIIGRRAWASSWRVPIPLPKKPADDEEGFGGLF